MPCWNIRMRLYLEYRCLHTWWRVRILRQDRPGLEWAKPKDKCPSKRREERNAGKATWRQADGSDASAGQGTPRTCSSHQKPRTPGNQPASNLRQTSGLWNRERINSVVLNHRNCGNLIWWPQEMDTPPESSSKALPPIIPSLKPLTLESTLQLWHAH